MSQSILTSIKITLGLPEAHTAYDQELLIHINSAIGTLTQLGVGPSIGYTVATAEEIWSDWLGPEDPQLNPVKTYIHLRVKMIFDPPDIGFVITAMKEQIKELEWRLNVLVDNEIPPKEVVILDANV
jgi:hypothetical protein